MKAKNEKEKDVSSHGEILAAQKFSDVTFEKDDLLLRLDDYKVWKEILKWKV